MSKKIEQRLNILVVTANPLVVKTKEKLAPAYQASLLLEVDKERQAIKTALGRTNKAIYVHFLPQATVEQLQQALLERSYQIFHFAGHGTEDGQLVLETDSGKTHLLAAEQLGKLLKDKGIKIALLNACFSQKAAKPLAKFIPATVSIQADKPIADQAAIKFARFFYLAIANNSSFSQAVAEAKKAVEFDSELADSGVPWAEFFNEYTGTAFAGLNIAAGSYEDNQMPINSNIPQRAAGEIFLGRQIEMFSLITELRQHQFVTLSGQAGVGKSSLARETGNWLLARAVFQAAVWHSFELNKKLTDLLLTFTSMIPELKSVTDIKRQEELILAYLSSRPCLLVFDNFETVLENYDRGDREAQAVYEFIGKIKGAGRVIITCRRRGCGFNGERIIELEELLLNEAKKLFVETVKMKGGVEIDINNADLEAVVYLLGQLPLPLELTAAYLVDNPALTLARLQEQLQEKGKALDCLIDGDRRGRLRLRDYRASLALSYDNLEPETKKFFTAFSVFAISATETALAALLAETIPNWEARLSQLRKVSLLSFKAGRYRQLPPIRRFAQEQQAEFFSDGDWAALKFRWATYFLNLTKHYYQGNEESFRGLNQNLDNIIAAADWLSAKVNDESATAAAIKLLAETAVGLTGCIYHCHLGLVAAPWLQAVLKVINTKTTAGDKDKLKESANIYNNIGLIYDARGDYDAALDWYRKSLEIKEKLGDLAGLAASYNNIGLIYDARGDYDAALDWYRKSLEIQEKLGDLAGLAVSYNNIGTLYFKLEKYSPAARYLLRAAAIFEQIKAPQNLETVLDGLEAIQEKLGAADFNQLLESIDKDAKEIIR